jgi:hypothetical protein
MEQEPFKNGDRAVLKAQIKVFAPGTPDGNVVPFYMDVRALKPDGFQPPGVEVTVVTPGPFFVLCISPVGVVYFRIENLVRV